MVMPEAKRKAIEHLHESFGRSIRKLCILVSMNRSSWQYKPKSDANEPIRKRLRELADERKRWFYRRLHYLLRREGFLISHKRTERLYPVPHDRFHRHNSAVPPLVWCSLNRYSATSHRFIYILLQFVSFIPLPP